jgi:hypothetical protein
MYNEQSFFVDWEKIKSQLSESPGNEQTIAGKMMVNDGIVNAFVYYLAIMW